MQFLRILFRLIFVLNKTENRGYWYECIQYVFMNIVSIIIVLEMGIPFYKNWGFPKLSPWYVTNWEFPLQNVSYNC